MLCPTLTRAHPTEHKKKVNMMEPRIQAKFVPLGKRRYIDSLGKPSFAETYLALGVS